MAFLRSLAPITALVALVACGARSSLLDESTGDAGGAGGSDASSTSTSSTGTGGSGGGLPEAKLALGSYHSCWQSRSDLLLCWGGNLDGQLGIGSTQGSTKPVRAELPAGTITAVSSGFHHVCAALWDGTVWCWGNNVEGQCGVEEPSVVLSPQQVPMPVDPGEFGVISLAAGEYHTCAGLSDGRVVCWGSNTQGQLGLGRFGGFRIPPTVVTELEGFPSLSAGDFFTCGLQVNGGAVRCTGQNHRGQLGDGSGVDSATPVAIEMSPPIQWIDAGGFGVVARPQPVGEVALWGWGDAVLLGAGLPESVLAPAPLQITAGWILASHTAGLAHSCAVANLDGTARSYEAFCWGDNGNGQLGDGSLASASFPVAVVGLPDRPAAIEAGGLHTCAVTVEGKAYCWGDNQQGQLGNGLVGGQELEAVPVVTE